jgi:hypothetical protein
MARASALLRATTSARGADVVLRQWREVLDRLAQDICRDEAVEGWGRGSSFREREP